jgi:cation diffusion facilitator family transporter
MAKTSSPNEVSSSSKRLSSSRRSSSKRVVRAAVAGNFLVAVTKIGAASWTGSSAMLSEAIHSVVDTANQLLLLYGLVQSGRPPDHSHPLGYGRELYFWSFIVALLMFALGAGASIYEGVDHIRHPVAMTDPFVNYIVLGCSFVFEASSWWIARREFAKAKGGLSYYEAVRRSKDPPTFLVLLEDSAALIGLMIAFAGTLLAQWLDRPLFDGLASIGVGLLLAGAGAVIARETKGLLIGERASSTVDRSLMQIAGQEPGVERANGVLTFQLGPSEVVATLSLEFADHLTAPEIESIVSGLEQHIRAAHPEVIAVFIKPQTHASYREVVQERYGDAAAARHVGGTMATVAELESVRDEHANIGIAEKRV